jgi:hypothetical protein
MNMIIWNTETFMKKLNSFCRDHVVTLKNHTLGEEPPRLDDHMAIRLPDKGLKSSLIELPRNEDFLSPARDYRKSNSILVPSASTSNKNLSPNLRGASEKRQLIQLHSVKECPDESVLVSVKDEPKTAKYRHRPRA